ncbi:MAG TPA: hypothetical protein VF682_11835 [Pseudomonas sp.]|jgi:ElaB/YqjD/DUF883 family membrane-anchored ribosome-binding protein
MIKPLRIALLTFPLLALAGCDQVETSTRQLLSTAANAAKHTLDQTHQAATKALDNARQDLSMAQPESQPRADKAHQEI